MEEKVEKLEKEFRQDVSLQVSINEACDDILDEQNERIEKLESRLSKHIKHNRECLLKNQEVLREDVDAHDEELEELQEKIGKTKLVEEVYNNIIDGSLFKAVPIIQELEKKIEQNAELSTKVFVRKTAFDLIGERIENLEAYNEHTFDAQLKEHADIIQENKERIEKFEGKTQNYKIRMDIRKKELSELKEKAEWNGKQIVHAFDSLIEKYEMIFELKSQIVILQQNIDSLTNKVLKLEREVLF